MGHRAVKRRYHSPRRCAQAAATRARLLDAAAFVFARDGYAAGKLETVARRARVALPTLYGAFGSKAALLAALIERVKEDAGVAQQYRALVAEPDPRQKLRLSAEITVRYSQRGWAVLEALRTLPPSERKLTAIWAQAEDSRRRGQATIIEALRSSGLLVDRLSVDEAVDVLWSLSAHDNYRLYVMQCRWSPERYAEFLADASTVLLVGPR